MHIHIHSHTRLNLAIKIQGNLNFMTKVLKNKYIIYFHVNKFVKETKLLLFFKQTIQKSGFFLFIL